MRNKRIICSLALVGCCLAVLIPARMNATSTDLTTDVQNYLNSAEGKEIIDMHKAPDGSSLGYKFTINHSTQIVTITYDDGYSTTFKYKDKVDNTIKPDTDSNVVYVNGYPVPKYIMESDDSALNARELYMKYHGDPSAYDQSMLPGNTENIPSKIDSNGNAVSMNSSRSKNCWVDGKYYGSDGYNVTGWQSIKSNWYYFSPDGIVQRGWKYLNGAWYYLENDGRMSTGWRFINNKWYYLNSDGKMLKGWTNINNTWYYLASDGSMQTDWLKNNNKWYYLDSNGAMHQGWLYNNSKWYYLDPSNGSMRTGWLHLGNKWYYLTSDGSMLTRNFKLAGVSYKVASDGSCTW